MKKIFVIAALLFAGVAQAAWFGIGAGSVTQSTSASGGGSLVATNGGFALAGNQTANQGAATTGSQTSIGPGLSVQTVGGTQTVNQTTTLGGTLATPGSFGAAGGFGAGSTSGGSFSGFFLSLP